MAKHKTNRSAKKRFRTTASGLFVRGRSHSSHIFTKKTTKRKRRLRKTALVADVDAPRVKHMLGH